jgi:preprotein translocase subunit SecG
MGFIIGLLTFIMVLDCLVLVFLVLIQLPKKEAGAGLAFGASASDALFGAGSGNVLTKITKYAAGIFFGLAIILSIMKSHQHSSSSEFNKKLLGESHPPGAAVAPMPAPAPNASTAPLTVTNPMRTTVEEAGTNRPAVTPPATNAPAVPNVPAAATTNTPAPTPK